MQVILHIFFKGLSRIRRKEALALIKSGNYDGAYYLSGYIIECGLKACIAKNTKKYDFPDKKRVNQSYTHNLNDLVKVAGLESSLNQEIKKDPEFEVNWTLVKDWSEESRYQKHTKQEANDFYNVITNRKNGVLKWINQHWQKWI